MKNEKNNTEKVHQILASSAFKSMVSLRWKVALSLTFLMLVAYLSFIFTVAFAKDFLATKIGLSVNIGLLLGVGLIFFTWILTGIYVYWANYKYDQKVNELKNNLLQ
jgi:uncharacterized membrane protein (DUF485 family)